MKSIIGQEQISLTIKRLANQVLEKPGDIKDVALIGIQPRGIYLSDRIINELSLELRSTPFSYGKLDITFYRDDHREKLHLPNQTDIPFSIEGKRVILVDDVLYTGRTIRAAMDALMDFGRPAGVELLVLIDRRYSRELPIQPDYTGRSIDSIISQKVVVQWKENDGADGVYLVDTA